MNLQSVPGGKVNILGGHNIGHSKKKIYMNICPIPNGFRYLASMFFNLALNIFLPIVIRHCLEHVNYCDASVGCCDCC
jgi:hypothetical protein